MSQVRKNFTYSKKFGKVVANKMKENKEFCVNYAELVKFHGAMSIYFEAAYIGYAMDTNSAKKVGNETAQELEQRKEDEARKELAKLTKSMRESSEFYKLLTNGNKLYSLVLDFAACVYDKDGNKHFAKSVTYAWNIESLKPEEIAKKDEQCNKENATICRCSFVVSGHEKEYFVKVGAESKVQAFIEDGENKQVTSRRADFEDVKEQGEFYTDKKGHVSALVISDVLTLPRLQQIASFSRYPNNAERIKELAKQRKADKEQRKADKEQPNKEQVTVPNARRKAAKVG